MRRHLQLGMVGCGDIAGYVAWFARLNPRIRLVACCDISPERAAGFARRFKIPGVYTDYAEMLAQGGLEAVYLATPHHLHAPMLEAAIRAGLPVFVEKPITRTLEEGQHIARLAREQGVKVGVNYQYRYDSGCYALARAIQRGDLGQIYYARLNLPWQRQANYFQEAGWHALLETAGGGTLITQGSHLLDVVLWALGNSPISAMGYTAQRKFRDVEVEDLAQATLEMQDGALVQICSAMVTNPEQAVTIEVYGERGSALYSNRPWPHVRFLGARVHKERPPHWGVHALQRCLEGFRAWVIEDRTHLASAHETLPTLAAVEAVYRSARTCKREEVALYPADFPGLNRAT